MEPSLMPAPVGRSREHWRWPSFVWGFAEATVFFIVPDVFITRFAVLGSYRRALLAAVWALVGSLMGGLLLWVAARHDAAPSLLRLFAHLPGINRDLIAETGLAMYRQGPTALFGGGLLGQPYKLFAVHAGAQHVPLATFLLISVPARFLRFSITATLAWLVGRGLRRWSKPSLLRLHSVVWLCFYTASFLWFTQ